MTGRFNILLVGVGGQGILTMFKILGNSAIKSGYTVNGAETHGMSQRGGSVYVHLRIGLGQSETISSPIIMKKQADLIVSLEPVEALRFAEYISPEGTIITSINPIEPPNLPLNRKEYPDITKIVEGLHKYTNNIITIDFLKQMDNQGIKSINIAMLGILTSLQQFPIPSDILENEIVEKLKKFRDEAQSAFDLGKQFLSLDISN